MRRVVLVFLFFAAVLVSRRPDVLFNAQFWAEDGKMWYADAYNLGVLQPFLHPAAGYFDTFPRLAALASLLLPLGVVPLLFSCIAIVFQVLPAQFLLSSRCSEWGVKPGHCSHFYILGCPTARKCMPTSPIRIGALRCWC
jgi:hypothetical protein